MPAYVYHSGYKTHPSWPDMRNSVMPTLHLLCGKIASGKSTLAKTPAAEQGAIVDRKSVV